MKEIALLILLTFSLYVGHTIGRINTQVQELKEKLSSACRSTACYKMDVQGQDVYKPISPIPTEVPAVSGEAWVGKVSHYSVSGCLGCSPTLTMANGEPLSDERATIAFNWLPMNTKVKVTNLDNGKSIEAVVTDTGGFNSLGRMADLTPAVYKYLETKTDITNVEIRKFYERTNRDFKQ